MVARVEGVGRRSFLGAVIVAGVAGLTGCGSVRELTSTAPPSLAPALAPVPDVGSLLELDRFVVAHRGSGDNWPEHTLTAYRSAIDAGAQAVEISVRSTADGHLVCHHDADFVRTSGSAGRVDETRYDNLPLVNARRWLGPNTPLEPIPLLTQVLAELPKDTLAFVEDKDGTNTTALLEILDDQPRSTERFVWKQWGVAKQVVVARQRGYRAWGYFGKGDVDRIAEFAESYDCLGIPVDASADALRLATAHGKPVMAWAVHTRSQATRLAAHGVAGLMCSNVPYVAVPPQPATIDSFDTGRRAPGDLPRGASDTWALQPMLVDHALRFTDKSASSYLLGSLCPLPKRCALTVRIGWPGKPHGAVGLSFGLPDDSDYAPGAATNSGGAHRVGLTSQGELAIWDDAARSASRRVRLAETSTDATNGSALLQLWLDDRSWTVRLGTGADLQFPRTHGGGYLWVWADRPDAGASVTGLRIE